VVGRHDVDQRVAGTKLGQSSLPLFEVQAEDIEIEPFKGCGIGCTQHDVIDPYNAEGCRHGRLLFKSQPILVASGADGSRRLKAIVGHLFVHH
jgi:hypothetical protein